ncbi:MAG: hypothetical protein ACRD4Q_14605 [Candidatus Acidiferrales bacterium]
MKTWRESNILVEIGPFDRPSGYAIARTDTGMTVRLWHYRLRKAQITPEHGVVPALAGKHVTTARARDGGYDVQTLLEIPRFTFQAKRDEIAALTDKLRHGQPLTSDEAKFVEFVTKLPHLGQCSDLAAWRRFNAEIELALADYSRTAGQKYDAACGLR